MSGIFDVLSGRRVEELKERMQRAIEAEDELVKQLKTSCKKMDDVVAALNSHKETLNLLLTELRNIHR